MNNIKNLFDNKLVNDFYKFNTERFYFYEWKNSAMSTPHLHDRCEIMTVLKGQCFIHIGGKRIKFASNSIILINANVSHRLEVLPAHACLMLNAEFNFAATSQREISIRSLIENSETVSHFLRNPRDYVIIRGAYDLIPFVRTLVVELSRKKSDEFMISQLYFLIFQIIARFAEDSKTTPTDNYEQQITKYLLEHYAYDITIRDIAKAVCIDSSYMQRLYKKKTGITIMEKLTQIRIDRAKEMLKDESFSISEVASYIGIDTSQYFATWFKRKTGMTPSQWRERMHI